MEEEEHTFEDIFPFLLSFLNQDMLGYSMYNDLTILVSATGF